MNTDACWGCGKKTPKMGFYCKSCRAKTEKKEKEWIAATLLNDETSTDEEMTAYFMFEGNMSRIKALFYVKQRNRALQEGMDFTLKPYSKSR